MDPEPAQPPAALPTCYRHPDRQTRLACTVCERPICTECTTSAPVGQRCPEHAKPDGRARVVDARSMARRAAPFTYGMIGLCVAIFVSGLFVPPIGDATFQLGAQANVLVAEGQWWRILTAALLHSRGFFLHILFNMYVLYLLGPPLERDSGTPAFALMYAACAAWGGAAYYIWGLVTDSLGGSAVGASGAIFGLFGAWVAVSWRGRHTAQGAAQLRQFGILLAINLALPFVFGGIAWQAHVGGLIAGALIALAWLPTFQRRGQEGAQTRMVVAGGALLAAIATVVIL